MIVGGIAVVFSNLIMNDVTCVHAYKFILVVVGILCVFCSSL